MSGLTGQQPNHATTLGISIVGRPAEGAATFTTIPDIEGCQVSFNGVVQKWSSMDKGGAESAAKTGYSIQISITAKRNYGNAAHDYIAGLKLRTGDNVKTIAKITYPDAATLEIPCIIDVKSTGGNTTDVDTLQFDIISDGAATFTA